MLVQFREYLKGASLDMQVLSAVVLAKAGLNVVEANTILVKALEDERSQVRETAANFLAEVGDENALKPLAERQKDEDEDVRNASRRAMPRIAKKVSEKVVAGPKRGAAYEASVSELEKYADHVMRSWNGEKEHDAAVVAVVVAGKPIVPLLSKMLLDKEESIAVRKLAAEALAPILDINAVPALAKALKEEDYGVQISAAISLGFLKCPAAVKALRGCLKDEDADDEVQSQAAQGLGHQGNRSVVPDLIEALKHGKGRVPMFAARALGELGDPKALQELKKMAKNAENERWRYEATSAISLIESAQSAPPKRNPPTARR